MFDTAIVILVMFSVYALAIFGLIGMGLYWKKSKIKGYFFGILVCVCVQPIFGFLLMYDLIFMHDWSSAWKQIFYFAISPFRIIIEQWHIAYMTILPIVGFYFLSAIIGVLYYWKTQRFKGILTGLFWGQVIFSVVYAIWVTQGLLF